MSYMSKGHLPDCEVPYNGGDCDCAWHWEEMAQVNKPKDETQAERKARLQKELADIEELEKAARYVRLETILKDVIKQVPVWEDQQKFRNMLTKHIQDTYDPDDE
jgi:uncharacterized Zn finger protein